MISHEEHEDFVFFFVPFVVKICCFAGKDEQVLNLYKLEIFVHVVEEGSFSAAAERLLMTQSGVSQHIRDLEAGLGAQLFERGRRGVTLTHAGQKLYDYTRRIFALVAEAENAVTDVDQLAEGQVKLGATPGLASYTLPEWIQSFRQRHPRLTVTLQTRTTPEIVTEILAGRLDIGIVEGEIDDATLALLNASDLQRIEQFVVVGQRHPYWERQEIDIMELSGHDFVMRQQHSQSRIWLTQVLNEHGITPRLSAEFDNVESIKRTVASGHGLAVLPAYAVRDEVNYGSLRTIPVAGQPFVRVVKLLWDRRRFLSPVTRALLAHLQGCYPALGEVLYV